MFKGMASQSLKLDLQKEIHKIHNNGIETESNPGLYKSFQRLSVQS